MAQDILLNPHKAHCPEFDLESIIYTIIYMGIIQEGPKGQEKTQGQILKFLWNWLHPEEMSPQDIGSSKLTMINYTPETFKSIVTDKFTPYMQDFIPVLREALRTKDISHKR